MKGGIINVDGSVSSQVLTGLLIALPLLQELSTLHVNSLVNKEYIDITLSLMN